MAQKLDNLIDKDLLASYHNELEKTYLAGGIVFDISAHKATGSPATPATFAGLAAALGTNGANIPQSMQKGGMTVKFLKGSAQSQSNKYVQYRLKTQTFSTSEADWECIEDSVSALEEAVGTGGDVDSRISAAVAAETTRAQAAETDRYTKSETYSKTELNSLITTPNQEYVSVVATAQTTSATDVLPAIGTGDTVYRVGNWDGTQYNDSVFSEYAWDGSAYIKLSTKSQVGEVYDISANHADTKYADLAAALGTNGANVPQSLRKGGMSVKFVQSSDNKYVQYRLMATSFSTDEADWQGVDDEPTAGSANLVKSGGVYPILEATNRIENEVYQITNIDFTDSVNGKYISNSGYLGDNASFSYKSFKAKVGDIIIFSASGYLDYVAMIATYVDGNFYSPREISIDSNENIYEYIIKESDVVNGEVIVYLSYDNTKTKSAKIYRPNVYNKEYIDNINIRAFSVDFDNTIANSYISSNGVLVNETPGWEIATFEGKVGDIIHFTATGYLDYVAMIATSNDGVIFNILSLSLDSSEHIYTATLNEDITVYLSFQSSQTHKAICERKWLFTAEETKEYVNHVIDENKNPSYLHLFNTIGIVGDSLSCGSVFPQSGNIGKELEQYSWLENICRNIQASPAYYSKGGFTAKDFCSDEFGKKSALLADGKKNAYYIALGTNDKNYFQLGTINDTQADDTFAGWYKEVISIIHNHAPNAVIFCVSLYETNTTADSFSDMIREISNLYDYCYFVDYIGNTEQNLKITSSSTLYIHNWHYTGIGYIRVADVIQDLTQKIVNDNIEYFKFYPYYQSED